MRNFELNYRADIDGLRAIAVLGVVIFHAQPDWLPGGFVGVDVFFVISGYLITRIIVSHEGDIGSFLRRFYERRVRRLVPPAIPVLISTGIGGWLLLPPAALEELAQSAIAYAIFASNWFFLSIAGYFDGPSHYKPLLHTWSLSIEEQFYILFPIPILLLMRRGLGAVAGLLAVILASSFAFSVMLMMTGQQEAAFFNSFARFWEIALGGLLALGLLRPMKSIIAQQAIGSLGMAAILISMIAFDETVSFPGASALLPTAGAAMIIFAPRSVVNRFLSTRPVVGIGLISYALYLWHWPVLVFIKYAIVGATTWHFIAGALSAGVLAWASYELIEKPVREKSVLSSSLQIFSSFSGSMLILTICSIMVWAQEGVPERFPRSAEYTQQLTVLLSENVEKRLRSVCWLSGEELKPAIDRCLDPSDATDDILLVGDSHAAQFYPSFTRAFSTSNVDLIAADSCRLQKSDQPTCDALSNWLDDLGGPDALAYQDIIFSNLLTATMAADQVVDAATRFARKGFRVTVLGPIQYYEPSLPILYSRMVGHPDKTEMLQTFTEAVHSGPFQVDTYLSETLKGTGINYVSLLAVTCPTGPDSCAHLDSTGLPVRIDASHLSAPAADFITDAIARKIRP